jgi:hemoglobin
MTTYDQIGGATGVAAAVDDFYARLLSDPEIAHYFDGVAMPRQIHHLRAFLGAALGGPERYLGRDIETAHSGLGVTESAFDGVVAPLAATLRHVGVKASTIADIGAKLAPLRAQVVGA